MSDLVDKATAWDAVAEKNARIAELEREVADLKRAMLITDYQVAKALVFLDPRRPFADLSKDTAEALAILEGRE